MQPSLQAEPLQCAQLLQVNSTVLGQLHSCMRSSTGSTAQDKQACTCGSRALRTELAGLLPPCSGIQCWLKGLLMQPACKLRTCTWLVSPALA